MCIIIFVSTMIPKLQVSLTAPLTYQGEVNTAAEIEWPNVSGAGQYWSIKQPWRPRRPRKRSGPIQEERTVPNLADLRGPVNSGDRYEIGRAHV